MVEEFCMPRFLKTLNVDEMTSLRWHEFNDMEYIVKQIHQNMSWKDCLVECVTLFHSCVNMFMYKHVLNDNGILGKVKKMLFPMNYNIVDLFMLTLYYGFKKKI
jgi:hypothetical protein